MRLNRPDIDRIGDSRHLVKVTHKAPEIRVVHDASLVTAERAVVDVIEPDDGREEPPISLGKAAADEIRLALQPLFELIQRIEKCDVGFVVRLL